MKKLTWILFLAASMAVTVGCGKSETPNNDSAPVLVQTLPPNFGAPGNSPGVGGATVALVSDSITMQAYAGHPVNNPQSLQININLSNGSGIAGSGGNFAGYVTVSYNDNGIQHSDPLYSGVGSDTRYNLWYTDPGTGKQIFHGFFEDEPPSYPETTTAGGVILVLDHNDSFNPGDGQPLGQSWSGSLWFRNYNVGTFPKPPTRCWFISLGPYDCQSWTSGGTTVNPTLAIYPDSGYQRLGTFSGLDIRSAFNGN